MSPDSSSAASKPPQQWWHEHVFEPVHPVGSTDEAEKIANLSPSLGPIPPPDPEALRRAESTIGQGWKLHLNFDPDQPRIVAAIEGFLQIIQDRKIVDAYKIGEGGGKNADAALGKEATVAVGSLDRSLEVARLLESELGAYLLPQADDVLIDDVPLSPRGLVWGRFDVRYADDHQIYGEGVPYLKEDVASLTFDPAWNKHNSPTNEELRDRAAAYDIATYGTFFNGSVVHFSDLIERKQQYLAEPSVATSIN